MHTNMHTCLHYHELTSQQTHSLTHTHTSRWPDEPCFVPDGGVSSWETGATCVNYKPLINNSVRAKECVLCTCNSCLWEIGCWTHTHTHSVPPCAAQTNSFGMCVSPCWHRTVWQSAGDLTPRGHTDVSQTFRRRVSVEQRRYELFGAAQ